MTGNMSRNKGKKAERDVVAWLNRNGFPHAERRGDGFSAGDIIGIPGVTIEIKNKARLDLAEWVDQLEDELDADRNDIGAVIAKRARKGNVSDWYAIMPAYLFARLLQEAGYGDLSGPADNKGNSKSLGRTRPNRKNQQP